jgi:hypothetical protein
MRSQLQGNQIVHTDMVKTLHVFITFSCLGIRCFGLQTTRRSLPRKVSRVVLVPTILFCETG